MNRRTEPRRPKIVGVMGGGAADGAVCRMAEELGRRIAENGWILLTGGRAAGVMQAASRGARAADGITVGILPDDHRAGVSEHVLIPILTGMGNARNAINVLTSDVVVALAGGSGTISEVALALKVGRPVVLLGFDLRSTFPAESAAERLVLVQTPAEVMTALERLLR